MTESLSDSVSLVVGAVAAQVIGGLITQMSPLVIGGLMQGLSLSERDAGFIASVELFTLTAAAITIAPLLPRFASRRVGLAAIALTAPAQFASIFSDSVASLAALRAVAGAGEGLLYALSLGIVAARSRNPDRLYGYFQVVWALGSAALFAIGGQLTAAFAQRGILALIAGVTIALAPLLLLIPNDRTRSSDAVASNPSRPAPLLGVLTLAATGLYLVASSALYAFSEPLGERAGLDTSTVGYMLTIATLVGLAGAGAATALNLRYGRILPISGFCVAFAIIALALCLSRDPRIYIVALVSSVVIYYFSIPYLFGLAAALDSSGSWAAAAGSAYLLGFAVGPLLGGVVIARAHYPGLAVACVLLIFATWAPSVIVSRRISEERRPPRLA